MISALGPRSRVERFEQGHFAAEFAPDDVTSHERGRSRRNCFAMKHEAQESHAAKEGSPEISEALVHVVLVRTGYATPALPTIRAGPCRIPCGSAGGRHRDSTNVFWESADV